MEKNSYNSYIKSVYRHLNLRLANALESTSMKDDDTIAKTIRRLRFCASISLVEFKDNHGQIIKTSGTCKSPLCYICQRVKSKKLQKRTMKVIKEDLKDLQGRYFYFMTLTMKHRDGNYLPDLKAAQNKLFRSKLFREHFGAKPGMIQSFENVIKPDALHIHSHILLHADRIKIRAKDLQAKISEKWLKITGDSKIVDFRLLAKKSMKLRSGLDAEFDEDAYILKSVKEILKYNTKVRHFSKMTDSEKELLAYWISSSKGKNMINARGTFRGFGIAANKSKLDEAVEDKPFDTEAEFFIDKTNQIKYSESTLYSHYNIQKKKDQLKEVRMTGLSLSGVSVTEFVDDISSFMMVFEKSEEDEQMRILNQELDRLKEFAKHELDLSEVQKEQSVQLMFSFIEQVKTHTHIREIIL